MMGGAIPTASRSGMRRRKSVRSTCADCDWSAMRSPSLTHCPRCGSTNVTKGAP